MDKFFVEVYSIQNDIGKKIFFEVPSSTRKYIESVGVSVRNSYEYGTVARLKKIFRANAIMSFIFFAADAQAPILGTI